ERVRAETPWWVPPVLDDKIYQKIIAAVERLLHDMVMDPAHPLRTAFDDAIRDFIERLQHSPEVIARAEALKDEWLMGAKRAALGRDLQFVRINGTLVGGLVGLLIYTITRFLH